VSNSLKGGLVNEKELERDKPSMPNLPLAPVQEIPTEFSFHIESFLGGFTSL